MHDGLDKYGIDGAFYWIGSSATREGLAVRRPLLQDAEQTDRQLLVNVPSEDPQHSRLKGSGAMLKTSVGVSECSSVMSRTSSGGARNEQCSNAVMHRNTTDNYSSSSHDEV